MKYPIFFILTTLITSFLFGCSKSYKKIYDLPIRSSQSQVMGICQQTDASHFTVRNSHVWLRKKNGKEIELKYNKFLLQDGYYFCTEKNGDSEILD